MKKLQYLLASTLLLAGIAAGPVSLRAQAPPATDDKAAIKAIYDQYNVNFEKKDVNAIMTMYALDVFAFDAIPPREYPTWAAYKKDWEGFLSMFPGSATSSIAELNISVAGSVAYTHCVNDFTLTAADGSKTRMVVRITDVLRKRDGKWLIVQEHVSFPVDPATGKADMLSMP
jgi:ketosteroid isomerase-like protein